jgi:tetracycline resistance efflux pump
MELTSPHGLLSILPPLLAIVLAIFTHRIILSLALGILCGALMACDYQWWASLQYIAERGVQLVWVDGQFNTWNLYLVGFLLILGVAAALISMSGGAQAFSQWATEYVKRPRSARIFVIFVGIMLFIDDYFNCITNGNTSRPITDRHQVSRANLAYMVDSTAVPMCCLMPISSWGAYIIAMLASIIVVNELVEYSALALFLQMAGLNFYAWSALLMVFIVSWFGWYIGPLRKHERLAAQGQLFNPDKADPMGAIAKLRTHAQGRIYHLLLPIGVLVLGTLLGYLVIGVTSLQAQQQTVTFIRILENTDAAKALFIGGAASLITAFILALPQRHGGRQYIAALMAGLKAMVPVIYILLAWLIIMIIEDLQTGLYLAGLIHANLSLAWLPVLFFVIAGLTALATGTSWGTFGLMLPLAGDISAAVAPEMLMFNLAAVLSGALFGDNASPISDTSIMSSTGAGCHLMDHVTTQLPYTLLASVISACAFIILGFSQSVGLTLGGWILAGLLVLLGVRWLSMRGVS